MAQREYPTHYKRKSKKEARENKVDTYDHSKLKNIYIDENNPRIKIIFKEANDEEYDSALNINNEKPNLLVNITIQKQISKQKPAEILARYQYKNYDRHPHNKEYLYNLLVRNFIIDETFRNTLHICGIKWNGIILFDDKCFKRSIMIISEDFLN